MPEGGSYGTRTIRWGTFPRRPSTARSAWRLPRRWATGRGRAGRTGIGQLFPGDRAQHAAPVDCQGRWREYVREPRHRPQGEYVKAVAYLEAQHDMARELNIAHMQARAALGNPDRPGLAGAGQLPSVGSSPAPASPSRSPRACCWRAPGLDCSRSSASSCLNDRVCETAKWLQAALDCGNVIALLRERDSL
jgi:hypothetical protein